MNKLGYFKNIDAVVQAMGSTMQEMIRIQNPNNPPQPAGCFVIKPPPLTTAPTAPTPANGFSVPGFNLPLRKIDELCFRDDTGLCFSVYKSMPILKSGKSILASALVE